MTDSKRVNIAHGEDQKCVLLSITHDYLLLLILLSHVNRKEDICQINGCTECTRGYVNLPSKHHTSIAGTAAALQFLASPLITTTTYLNFGE